MGNEDGGDLCLLLDPAALFSGLETESGIPIGKGLVSEKYSGQLDQSSGDGNTLLLTAGEFIGFAFQQVIDLYQLRRFQYALTHFFFGKFVGTLQVL